MTKVKHQQLIKLILSERALFERLLRTLAKQGLTLRVARGARMRAQVGEYFVCAKDRIVERDADLRELASKYGVLRGWEDIEPEKKKIA